MDRTKLSSIAVAAMAAMAAMAAAGMAAIAGALLTVGPALLGHDVAPWRVSAQPTGDAP